MEWRAEPLLPVVRATADVVRQEPSPTAARIAKDIAGVAWCDHLSPTRVLCHFIILRREHAAKSFPFLRSQDASVRQNTCPTI